MLNSLHPDRRFTIECSDKQLPFLDVLVKKKGSRLETDIYHKPTDSKQYLLFNLCHLKHTRASIPYSLARRIRSIVTNDEILQIRMNELRLALKQQNYPVNVIEKGIDKAMKLRKEELRIVRERLMIILRMYQLSILKIRNYSIVYETAYQFYRKMKP